jgi:hypothetical protein
VSWSEAELAAVGAADVLRLASRRPDGTLRQPVTIWVVRAGDELVVRSAHGRENGWFRRAAAAGRGRVEADGVAADVRFEEVPVAEHLPADAAYHAKYDHYPKEYVDPVVDERSWGAALRLVKED